MKHAMHHFLFIALILLGGLQASAQEIQFNASVDRNSIATGEYVRLTISLTNSSERFGAPDLGGLVIVQGPFESSSFNLINGRMSSSVSRQWTLTATSPGKYTIGPARIKVGGGVIQTAPITIEVSKGAARPSDPNAAQGQSRDANLFATVSVSRNKGYVGEQVIATYLLYCRYSGLEITKYDLPKLDGFWAEEVDLGETNWEDQPQTVNGLQYRVAVLKKQILFPQRSGKLRIEPLELNCVVNRTFFNPGTTIPVRSNAVEFTALSLPPGAPPGFSGAVGELQFEVKADRTAVKANEAVEVAVRVSGRSNLKLLEAPKLDLPGDFETYDPKVIDKISVNGSGMSGSREFQFLAIPRHEGRYELEPISFSYFDTKTSAYRTLEGAPIVIEVSPGDGSATAQIQRPSKTDVQVLEHDIRYIRTGDLKLRPNGHYLFGSLPWIAGMTAPALGLLLFLGWHRKRERDIADVAGTRRKRADQVARKRLQEAATALASGAREPFYTALAKALQGYLADKFSLGFAELTAPIIREHLALAPEGDQLADSFTRLITTCEMARFAPVEDRPRKELYEEAAALIARAESNVPPSRTRRTVKTAMLFAALVSAFWIGAPNKVNAASPIDESHADTLVERAERAYAAGDYERALELLDTVRAEYTSPGLLLNIGNCYYKLGDIPRAVLNYERGLRLAPGDEDLQANLDLARERVTDRVNQLPAFALGSTWSRVRGGRDVDQWARRSLWAGLAFFVLLGAGLTLRKRWLKRVLLGTSGAAFVFLVIAVVFAAARHAEVVDNSEAIILAPKVDVLSEPRTGTTVLFVLHKGTKVTVLQEQNKWYEVKLPNGSVGWMPPSSLERI